MSSTATSSQYTCPQEKRTQTRLQLNMDLSTLARSVKFFNMNKNTDFYMESRDIGLFAIKHFFSLTWYFNYIYSDMFTEIIIKKRSILCWLLAINQRHSLSQSSMRIDVLCKWRMKKSICKWTFDLLYTSIIQFMCSNNANDCGDKY